MINLLFVSILGCMKHKAAYLGAVDTVEKEICNIQLADGKIVTVESEICRHLHEGDILKVVSNGSR